jgi:L-lactate dehydrogenase complex protein LldG
MINNNQQSKNNMIKSLRQSLKENQEIFPLPDLNFFSQEINLDQKALIIQFENSLKSVGGELIIVSDLESAKNEIKKIFHHPQMNIISCVTGIDLSNLELNKISDPHQLDALDLAILPGTLGVAENGAIWVDGTILSHRALISIPENLILVFSIKDLLANMHQAYQRINFVDNDFGVFISGPSKTADIEQSLVIGAQGARRMLAIMMSE